MMGPGSNLLQSKSSREFRAQPRIEKEIVQLPQANKLLIVTVKFYPVRLSWSLAGTHEPVDQPVRRRTSSGLRGIPAVGGWVLRSDGVLVEAAS